MSWKEGLERQGATGQQGGSEIERPSAPIGAPGEPARAPHLWRNRMLQAGVALLVLGAAGFGLLNDPGEDPASTPRMQAPSVTAHAQHRLHPDTSRRLTNGCRYSMRGIPQCGALLGAAYGSNTSVLGWEGELGHTLGIHRTYYAPDRVTQAVAQAREDVAHGRIPWMSFKLPHSWKAMAAGEGDGWVRDIADRLAKLDGPVWVAFHHEPENDGPMYEWTEMQHRLAPLVHRVAPNVAYTIILTGYNQIYGAPWLSLDAIWPRDTDIDLIGFDVYNDFGVRREDGSRDTSPTDLGAQYFVHFEDFAKRYGVPWAVSETGITDEFAASHPHWIRHTYQELIEHHGVAMSYFNSSLHSTGSWPLDGGKEADFADTLSGSPTLEPPSKPSP